MLNNWHDSDLPPSPLIFGWSIPLTNGNSTQELYTYEYFVSPAPERHNNANVKALNTIGYSKSPWDAILGGYAQLANILQNLIGQFNFYQLPTKFYFIIIGIQIKPQNTT